MSARPIGSAKQAISHRRPAHTWHNPRAYVAPLASSKPLSRCRPLPWIRACLAMALHCTRMSPGSMRARNVQTVRVVWCRQAAARLRRQLEHMQLAMMTSANVPRSCRQTPWSSRRCVPTTGNMAGSPPASARYRVRTDITRVRSMRRSRARQTQALFGRRIREARSRAQRTRSAGPASSPKSQVLIVASPCASLATPGCSKLWHRQRA